MSGGVAVVPGPGLGAVHTTRSAGTSMMSKVKAQVMTRDDSTGGWVPISGGGLSNVMLIKRMVQSSIESSLTPCGGVPGSALIAPSHATSLIGGGVANNREAGAPLSVSVMANNASNLSSDSALVGQLTKNEYIIVGTRIADKNVVLYCPIKRDFQYNKVMPTFHHWMSGNSKFGLTFVTATEARYFDKAIKDAINDLLLDGKSTRRHFPSPLHAKRDLTPRITFLVQVHVLSRDCRLALSLHRDASLL